MARKTRLTLPGVPHHVTQRGNNRRAVFLSDDDRRRWLELLHEQCLLWRVKLLGHCLMTNHVHLLVVPQDEEGISRLMCRVQSDYARLLNLRQDWCGHLWHERFYSCPLSETDAMRALAYIETNPVRAGMVAHAVEYPWSSARVHVDGHDPEQRLDLALWSVYYTPQRWREVLEFGITEEAWRERFRQATMRGIPCGPDEFIADLEQRVGRPLRALPRGRPKASTHLSSTSAA